MAKIRFEMEVEVVRLYTIPIFAENLAEAALKCKSSAETADQVEGLGQSQDHEINIIGVTRQTGRKMYQ